MPSKINIRKFFEQLFERHKAVQVGDVIESDENAECEEFDTKVKEEKRFPESILT